MAVWVRVAGLLLAPAILLSISFAEDQGFDYKKQPLGLMPIIWPSDNPYSAQKAYLGRLLYFDTRLSADGTVSCGRCHKPDLEFTDGAAVSVVLTGHNGTPNPPPVLHP